MKNSWKLLAGVAFGVLIGGSAQARPIEDGAAQADAQDEAAQPTNAQNASGANEKGEIIVTAQRRAEVATDVPLSITTQTGLQLERAGVENTMELTRVVPGLTFTGTGAWAMPSMRGVSTTVSGPGNDSPVAIYIDGTYLPNQLGGFFDLPDIDRIEVDKGPQGTLFGRNATGGAIQIFTRAPSFTPEGNVTATAGLYTGSGSSNSATELGVKGYLTGPVANDVAASLSFHYNHTGGYLDDIVRDENYGKIVDYGFRGKLLFEPSSSVKFTLAGFYNRRRDELAASAVALFGLSVATQFPGAIVTEEPWQITSDQLPLVKTRTWGLSLRGDIDAGRGTLTTLTSLFNIRVDANVDTDLSYSEACLLVSTCVDFKLPNLREKTFSQEVYYASDKWGPFSFVVGANTYRSTGFQPGVINDFSEVAPFPSVVNAGPIFAFAVQVKTEAYAAYSELNFDATDRLHLTAGARFSHENKKGVGGFSCCDVDALSPFVDKSWRNFIMRASARYELDDDTNVYATFSQGFKSGVVPYSDFSAPPANPEKINSYEVGLKRGGRTFPFSIAAFYYDYKDLQVQTFDRIVSSVTNAAAAHIFGIDFDGTWRPSSDLDFRLGISYLPTAKYSKYAGAVAYNLPMTAGGLTQYILDLSDHRLIKTPKLTSSFTASYHKDLGSGVFTASGTLYYSSAILFDNAEIMREGGYAALSSEISYQPIDSSMKFSIWGKNLTNAAYIASAIPGAPTPYALYAPPRQIGASINFSF